MIRSRSEKKQQGVAFTIFLLMIPVLMGFMALGIEGGRYLRLKSSVVDATEVAALAIIATDSLSVTDEDDIDEKLENAKALAKKYIHALVPDTKAINVSIERTISEDAQQISVYAMNNADSHHFLQYRLKVEAPQVSLLPALNKNGIGFSANAELGSFAIARKFSRQSEEPDELNEAVDVIFVADFSGSMDCPWGIEYCQRPQNNSKIDMLKDIVNDISDYLYEESINKESKNHIALVPFNGFTHERKEDGTVFSMRQMYHASDPQSTIDRMFEVKDALEDPYIPRGDAYFYSVALTDNAPYLKQALSEMLPGWATISYDGIIRGAQIALEGINRRRLIIVLSDGVDSDERDQSDLGHDAAKYHEQLNDLGYCDTIRSKLDSQMVGDQNVESEIAVIAFNYDLTENNNLIRCAGPENAFLAENKDELHQMIMNVITGSSPVEEEIGRLGQPL